MKPSTLWSIVAILLGISIFGLYKSLDLLKKNIQLSQSLAMLKTELAQDHLLLQKTQGSLKESNSKRDQLENEINILNASLAGKEREIHRYLTDISQLSEKLQKAMQANEELAQTNREMGDEFIRLLFANSEMKKRLSSIQELKQAIKDLKTSLSRQTRDFQQKKRRMSARDTLTSEPAGNRGYLLRDGRLTSYDVVSIEVRPIE